MLLSLFSFCFSENPFHVKAANFTLCRIMNLHLGRQYLYSKQYIVKITHFNGILSLNNYSMSSHWLQDEK